MKDQLVVRDIKNTEDYIREYLKGKHRRNNLVKWVGGIAEVVYFWLVPMEHISRSINCVKVHWVEGVRICERRECKGCWTEGRRN